MRRRSCGTLLDHQALIASQSCPRMLSTTALENQRTVEFRILMGRIDFPGQYCSRMVTVIALCAEGATARDRGRINATTWNMAESR